MIWVNNISDLEYFNPNPAPAPVGGCYADTIFEASDIILQAQLGTYFDFTSIVLPTVNILKPDGTFIENGNPYFNLSLVQFTLNGITYYYAQCQCHTYSPGMISNGCFVIELICANGTGTTTYFHGYTQKYALSDPSFILPSGITITTPGSGNLATLCVIPADVDPCDKPFVKLVSFCDCIDSFNGDFFGDGVTIATSGSLSTPFDFVRLSWIEGRIKELPTTIKRTISINNRTQRTERTTKRTLIGSLGFPVWKMREIEDMLLQNHIFVNDEQIQSEGDAPFTQLGTPQGCHYAYKLELELQDPYEWQVFGCTPQCVPLTYYYPITF